MQKVNELLSILEKYSSLDPECKFVFCSTCGGKYFAFQKNATLSERNQVELMIQELSAQEISEIREWREGLAKLYPRFKKILHESL